MVTSISTHSFCPKKNCPDQFFENSEKKKNSSAHLSELAVWFTTVLWPLVHISTTQPHSPTWVKDTFIITYQHVFQSKAPHTLPSFPMFLAFGLVNKQSHFHAKSALGDFSLGVIDAHNFKAVSRRVQSDGASNVVPRGLQVHLRLITQTRIFTTKSTDALTPRGHKLAEEK